ncbi:hypothetical protein [Neobacillus sp. NPDC093127]|uniref:hypothetical protein n=1 Tax=Neobacillus sp. NPDC093127 TaxID=3364296 RepID=UPI003830A67B
MNAKHLNAGVIGQPQNQAAAIDEENDMQVATVRVTPSGFDPKNTTFKANSMIKVK